MHCYVERDSGTKSLFDPCCSECRNRFLRLTIHWTSCESIFCISVCSSASNLEFVKSKRSDERAQKHVLRVFREPFDASVFCDSFSLVSVDNTGIDSMLPQPVGHKSSLVNRGSKSLPFSTGGVLS